MGQITRETNHMTNHVRTMWLFDHFSDKHVKVIMAADLSEPLNPILPPSLLTHTVLK
jgi:hypothetical protein